MINIQRYTSFSAIALACMPEQKARADASLKPSIGSCVPVPNGVSCHPSTVTGTASTSVSRGGVTKASGKSCIFISLMTRIWKMSSSIAPSCGHIPVRLVRPKKGGPSNTSAGPQSRRLQHQNSCECGCRWAIPCASS